MTALENIDWLDIAIVVLLLLALMWGYGKGFVRQAFNLAGLYLGLILASQFHGVLATWAHAGLPQANLALLSAIMFLLIVVVVAAVANYLGRLAYPVTRILFLGLVDRLGGAVLAFVLMFVQLVYALVVLRFLLRLPLAAQYAVLASLGRFLDQARLAPLLLQAAPILNDALRPWMPGGVLPPILRG